MKKVFFASVSLLTILAVACLAGCSNPSSGNDTPPVVSPTEPQTIDGHTVLEMPSLSAIVGTWKASGTQPILDTSDIDGDDDFTEIIGTATGTNEYVIKADKSFIRYSTVVADFDTEPDDVSYSAEKGTIKMTDGHWEKTITATGTPTSAFQDPANIGWYDIDYPSMMSDEICIIDDSLYEYTYRRVGSGSGIVGNWARVHKSRWFAEPDWSVEYNKYAYSITATTVKFSGYFNSATETFGAPSSTFSYAYTLGADGTLTDTTKPESNKVLILGNVFVYVKNGYAKQ